MLTGLRRSELFRLELTDIDSELRLITLRAPKGGKTLTIPISKKAAGVLDEMDRYAHLVPNALKRAAEASAEIMTRKHGQALKIVK